MELLENGWKPTCSNLRCCGWTMVGTHRGSDSKCVGWGLHAVGKWLEAGKDHMSQV